jgi:hypothetical protein
MLRPAASCKVVENIKCFVVSLFVRSDRWVLGRPFPLGTYNQTFSFIKWSQSYVPTFDIRGTAQGL